MIQKIELKDARACAVAASGIGPRSGLDASKDQGDGATLTALRRLGSVQIDTLSVVERAHHHVLWTRNPRYEREDIEALEAEPRRIIEYWSHAAAYLPIEDYRFCIPRMERIRERGHQWFRAEPAAIERVRDRLSAEGALRAQDFSEPMRGEKGWWDWKPAKIALEYLFQSGEVVVIGRRGFQKVYDLAERALPTDLDLRRPSAEEMAAFYVDRAARVLGVFTAEDVAYMREDGIELIPREISARVEDGSLLELDIQDIKVSARRVGGRGVRPIWYASAEDLERGAKHATVAEERKAFVLSPFDPLIIDRKRCLKLFGRVYQIECYLPEPKRSFGYFALPILTIGAMGEAHLVGRVDAKANRDRGVLELKRLYLDTPEEALGPGMGRVEYAAIIAQAIENFAAFNGTESIELGLFESPDGRLERSLRSAIARRARR